MIWRPKFCTATAVTAAAVGAIGLAAAILAAALTLRGVSTRVEIDATAITSWSGQAFQVMLPHSYILDPRGDTIYASDRSTLRIFENERPLGPPHSLHAIIEAQGHGTFSHWDRELIFSSSDGTDPRYNGRPYSFAVNYFLPVWIGVLGAVIGIAAAWPMLRWGWCTVTVVRPTTAIGVATKYATSFTIVAVAIMATAGYSSAPDMTPALGAWQPLPNRVQYYLQHAADFNVVFLGDSRSYCAMHPELIESYLPNMHGLNLANFANWFPTQLPIVRDIAGSIPAGTVVVWSVGHQNFFGESFGIQRIYPISIGDLGNYLVWSRGRIPNGVMDNVGYYHPMLRFYIAAQELRARIIKFALRAASDELPTFLSILSSMQTMTYANAAPDALHRLSHFAPAPPPQLDELRAADPAAATTTLDALVTSEDPAAMLAAAQKDTRVGYASLTREDDRVTSLVVWFKRGGYYRIELDPAYFRRKQEEMGSGFSIPGMQDRLLWRIFVETLDLLAAHHVKVIVNEVEEAPFQYSSMQNRERWRKFMRETVRPEVERRGFTYARANWDMLDDTDYFDFNHLNSKGIAKYTPMIADIIRDGLPVTP